MSAAAKPLKSKGRKKKLAKKPRGWGPFQSVLKERSVDFNLTLDVQNLKQQVQDLTTLRDVLSTRSALRRHSPEGSLFHVVQEYFHVFRTGWAVQESGRKRLLEDRDQRAFLHSIMDPHVDLENGLFGPDAMAEQIVIYSTFIRFIRTTLEGYEIVVAEDSVVIKTQARLRFQVTRRTIETIFPHVIGDEYLVAQLVGQEVEPPIGITFHFNAEGKCSKYEFDVDFVAGFSGIIRDPRKLEMLLGKALIADNCMFGILDEPPEEKRETLTLGEEGDRTVEEVVELEHLTDSDATTSPLLPAVHPVQDDTHYLRVVGDYYRVFENGYQAGDGGIRQAAYDQTAFITQAFTSQTANTLETGGSYVQSRWKALSECFGVLSFQQNRVLSVEHNDGDDVCIVRSVATYMLRIKPNTLETVFPHVLPHRELAQALRGSLLVVPSKLVFFIDRATARISHIAERLDFVKAMTALLPDADDVAFVMAQALLSLDGVSCRGGVSPQSIATRLPVPASAWIAPKSDAVTAKPLPGARAMTMANILNE